MTFNDVKEKHEKFYETNLDYSPDMMKDFGVEVRDNGLCLDCSHVEEDCPLYDKTHISSLVVKCKFYAPVISTFDEAQERFKGKDSDLSVVEKAFDAEVEDGGICQECVHGGFDCDGHDSDCPMYNQVSEKRLTHVTHCKFFERNDIYSVETGKKFLGR